ncbi:Uncharacterised protein [Mycobacteroides abscessus]|nr:Uncharacterised protein [Mycobacteroides abscessus]
MGSSGRCSPTPFQVARSGATSSRESTTRTTVASAVP